MIAFCIQASAPPFALFVIAYAINGFGESLEDAQANGFVASYKDNASAKMGIVHAAYGKCAYPSMAYFIPSIVKAPGLWQLPSLRHSLPSFIDGRFTTSSRSRLRC
jgi:fucose permease